jgi:gliding motility-associated lipoprotein GldH
VNRAFGVVALMLAVLVCGCGEPPLVAETADVDLEGWSSDSAVTFYWDVQDTLSRHDLILDLRHASTYAYSNMYLFLTYRFPNGKSRIDTVECTLADELGRWRGSGFGDLVDQRFMLQPGIQFPLRGRYGLQVMHGMRQDPIEGMANVGIRLEKSVTSNP